MHNSIDKPLSGLEFICQRKRAKIEKDGICENFTRTNHDYSVGY